jgi:hypothetical protein
MQSKALLIPIAAFALSATTAYAFSPEVLQQAGLTEDQIGAFEDADALRREGDLDGARDVLRSAGIDLSTMETIRETMSARRKEMRTAIDEAIENDDYGAFRKAIEGSPLADIVTSKSDFELFAEAHRFREVGEFQKASAILSDLGFPKRQLF